MLMPRGKRKNKSNKTGHEDIITNDTVVDATNIEAFIRKIHHTLPGEIIEREDNAAFHGAINLTFIDRRRVMVLQFGDTWGRVLKYMALTDGSYKPDKFCPVCMEQYRGIMWTCHECRNGACVECSIKMFVDNEGLMICVHCRHTIGEKMHPYQCRQYAAGMRLKELMRQRDSRLS